MAYNIVTQQLMSNLFSPDVNECVAARNGGCNQTCTNTLGSFECSCDIGYILDTNRRSCNGNHNIAGSYLAIILCSLLAIIY